MLIKAKAKYIRIAPRKVRLVADAVRGMNVQKALNLLQFQPQGSSGDVAKVIKSASANLRDKFQDEALDNQDLVIKTIMVDEGVTLKRIQPAPQGRAHPIRKRSCHITVVVTRDETNVKD